MPFTSPLKVPLACSAARGAARLGWAGSDLDLLQWPLEQLLDYASRLALGLQRDLRWIYQQ